MAFPLALIHSYFSKTEERGEDLLKNCYIASLPKQNIRTHSLYKLKKKNSNESNTEPAQVCTVSWNTGLVKQTISVLEKMTFLVDKGNHVDRCSLFELLQSVWFGTTLNSNSNIYTEINGHAQD